MLKAGPYDICIVGGGIAGALVAAAVARRGMRVVVVEAGSRFDFKDRSEQLRRWEILGGPLWQWEHTARDRYVDSSEKALGAPYNLNESRVKALGGTTLHWGGMALRLRESDFQTATLYGFGTDWPITYADLEPYYSWAEWEIGVSGIVNPTDPPRSRPYPMPGFPPKYGEYIWRDAADKLGVSLESPAHARNSRPYGGRSQCVAYSVCNVCPSGARYSADFHIAEAERSGRCDVLAETVARRIEVSESGYVRAIHASALDGKEYEIRAARFVIAAHAVESARLLLLSNVGNDSGQVGRNLMEHWYVSAIGLHHTQSFPDRIGFPTLQCGAFYDGSEREERGAIDLIFDAGNNLLIPLKNPLEIWGSDYAEYDCREFGHRVMVHAETEQQPNPESRITLDENMRDVFGDPVPHLHFELSDVDHGTHRRARELCRMFLDTAGATEIADIPTLFSPSHHMGTCRMSKNPELGVVDADCRIHGINNLYVVGSSVFPTCGARQPTLTIAALALRLADQFTSE